MAEASAAIGFFGKLPSHGDFVRRSLPAELVNLWDPWLQAGLAESRQVLGETWMERYLSGPIWRFGLSAGVCGEAPWLGAMMPSVDRVGRYFPLTVAARIPADQGLFAAAAGAGPWLGELEQVMLRALEEDGLTADDLAEQLAGITPLPGGAPGPPGDDPCPGEPSAPIAVPLGAAAELQEATAALIEVMAWRYLGPFSLWWSAGSAYVEPTARVYSGLPAKGQFWTLLSQDRPSD
ncbi:MAG: type VI secretion system-associated protein TagF [Chromatiaceae bacterium]|jgi:type VI secretion system protein ImpM|nr:type VI secretion system-associated protein TagF [Chromatiaceae bacterium]